MTEIRKDSAWERLLVADVEVYRERLRAVALIHGRSIYPATTGDHRGSYYCRGCTTSVDDFTAYVDWPCPTMRALMDV